MQKKVAWVTGASRGIGAAIARRLGKDGYDLVLVAKKNLDGLEAIQRDLKDIARVHLYLADLKDVDQVAAFFDKALTDTGRIDLLINNAGISHIGLVQDTSISQWYDLVHTNLTSVFALTRLALPVMVQAKNGAIINISSVWGQAGASMEAAYSATKGGLNAFTKALAKELAPSNIRVNAIACGAIDTDMNAVFTPQEKEALCESIGLGRLGKPEEIASVAAFLGSDESSYLTGQVVVVDGGMIDS